MNILQEIVARKKEEVAFLKQVVSAEVLRDSKYFNIPCRNFPTAITYNKNKLGVIAEFKRRSPSKGIISDKYDPKNVANMYKKKGASALSVLTDIQYFGGSLSDLLFVRNNVDIPILRKEFIVDEYQIIESKSYGADCILLIAACLTVEEVQLFSEKAHELGLFVLLEVHSKEEIEKYFFDTINVIGVNNRNLNTFETSVETSLSLSKHIPEGIVKISESGISTSEDIQKLHHAGFHGVLIGESLMKSLSSNDALQGFFK